MQNGCMESRSTPSDAALASLVETRKPIATMSWLAIAGLAFWLLICAVMALGCYDRLAEGSYSAPLATLAWSLIGVPVLLHIWPILALRRTAKALGALATAPSEASAVVAARAQRLYWRAAAICHLAIIAWWILACLAIALLVVWENNQPATLRTLDVPR